MIKPQVFSSIVDALGIPAGARVDARVPKTLFIEQGMPTAADKRAVQDGIEDIYWIGALKPNTVGVKAFLDDVREYLEIAVLTLTLKPDAKSRRLIELIHRAIPYPVLLLSDDGAGPVLSLAHKRSAQNEAGKVVMQDLITTPPLGQFSESLVTAFLASLAVSRQPSCDLYALFEGWRSRIEALNVAQVAGVFAPSDDMAVIEQRRAALAEYERLMKEVAQLKAQAARARQINQKVEINQKIKVIIDMLASHKQTLIKEAP